MDTIINGILSGGLSGAALTWILRNWISERLKQGIQHEYAQKLESYKADLNTRITMISHENQLRQLKTSLFFDHQREAFTDILVTIENVKDEWMKAESEYEDWRMASIPQESLQKIIDVYHRHLLFLDRSCLAAIELIISVMQKSIRLKLGGIEPIPKTDAAFRRLEFLQLRLIELFQQRIGLNTRSQAEREIALLGAIILLNGYHFPEIGFPVKGALQITDEESAVDAVSKAESNTRDVVDKLNQVQTYFHNEGLGIFQESSNNLSWYIETLGINVT